MPSPSRPDSDARYREISSCSVATSAGPTVGVLQWLNVTLGAAEERIDLRGQPFTVYQLRCESDILAWTVDKRYSEFDRLHNQLKDMGLQALPELPGKKIALSESSNAKLTQQRQQKLQMYVDKLLTVLKVGVVQSSIGDFVLTFLGMLRSLLVQVLTLKNQSEELQDHSDAMQTERIALKAKIVEMQQDMAEKDDCIARLQEASASSTSTTRPSSSATELSAVQAQLRSAETELAACRRELAAGRAQSMGSWQVWRLTKKGLGQGLLPRLVCAADPDDSDGDDDGPSGSRDHGIPLWQTLAEMRSKPGLVLMEGWVQKQSFWLHTWRRRWMVVTLTHAFTFHSNRDSSFPSVSFPLQACTCSAQHVAGAAQDCSFVISCGDHPFLFTAISPSHRDRWLQQLQVQPSQAGEVDLQPQNGAADAAGSSLVHMPFQVHPTSGKVSVALQSST